MKKAFDQTVRDLKREVNKKVLKVPGIEQKVLDATSNEPWGPHGTHLADLAQATQNYNEYHKIMAVLWKRINDTGKNWRHVYKALTVLEYLVAHGSERVIDEIREHAYHISTLSDFQYIDSGGRDQGTNVRRKSQSLVALVNDKERIREVREKANVNKDKFCSASSTGGMYRPNSYSNTGGYGDCHDDDRDEGRNQNGYGRERERSNRDGDRYGRVGDSYRRDGDYYDRDGYRDDDYRGSRSNDDYQFESRSRSSDRDRSFGDEDRSGADRANEHSQDERRRFEHTFSEQNGSAPPSYEEAVGDIQNHIQDERDGGNVSISAPKTSSPPRSTSQDQDEAVASVFASPKNQELNAFDEFDPRGPFSAAPPAASTAEMDFLGSLLDSVMLNSVALMTASIKPTSDANAPIDSGHVALSSASPVLNQPNENPFGDSPFKATPSPDNSVVLPPEFRPSSSFQPVTVCENSETIQVAASKAETISNFEFGDTFQGITYAPSHFPTVELHSTSSEFLPPELPTAHPLPESLPPVLSVPQATLHIPTGHPAQAQPPQEKFEPKSTVWADTLSRGLVNLNISGPKINPMADIGIDFDSINWMEKRREKEKHPATSMTSTVTMGKAMGSGSGIRRAGATSLAPPPNPMVGSSMGMVMGGYSGGMTQPKGIGTAGYSGGMTQPMGMGMGGYSGGMTQPMGMGVGMNMGMGMNVGMGQAAQMPPTTGLPPSGPIMPGVYNPFMGMGAYTSQ